MDWLGWRWSLSVRNSDPMKHQFAKRYIDAVAVCVALCLGGFTRADGSDDDGEQGGDIEGTEHLDEVVILTATNNAPFGATGQAELQVDNEDGTTTATLEREVLGLNPAAYSVSVST